MPPQGETAVAAGVKLELAAPTPESPDRGFIVPNVDLPPMCHSQFKPGPPPDLAQAASDFLRRVIADSGMLDPRNEKKGAS